MANFGLHVAYPLPDHVVEARRRAAAERVRRERAGVGRTLGRLLRRLVRGNAWR